MTMTLTPKQKLKGVFYLALSLSLVGSLYVVDKRKAEPKTSNASYSQPINKVQTHTFV